MANIISVIQPGGSSGSSYNVRATGIRHFVANSQTEAQYPVEGCVSVYNNTVKITCGQITELFAGLMFTTPIPVALSASASLQINTLASAGLKVNNGLSTASVGGGSKVYFIVYDGTNFMALDTVNAAHNSSDIVDGGMGFATANAVYDFVTSQLSNRWDYVICAAQANQIPNGATYKSSGTTITGSMAASADTMYTIYLVKHDHDTAHGANDAYDEWITLSTSGSTYTWEKIGNTDIDITDIANNIATNIIGSIADHTYVKVTSASVNVGTHGHNFEGSPTTSTGTFTPSGIINVGGNSGTDYTPSGVISVGGDDGASYTPSGDVSSSFTGSHMYIKVDGGGATTITVSTSNVYTDGNSSGTSNVTWGTGSGYTTTTPTATIAGSSNVTTLSTLTSNNGEHSHTISGNGSSSPIDGSSFTVSQKSAMAVTISTAQASSADYTFKVEVGSVVLSTQPEFEVMEEGSHAHIGTVAQRTLSGTISNIGSAAVYNVSGEVLTIEPGAAPGSAVSVTFSTATVTISTAQNHTHELSRSVNAAIKVSGDYVKLTATTPAHDHTLSGSVTPTITMGGTISTAASHKHDVEFKSQNVANALNVTVGQIGLLVSVGDHNHKITSLSASGSYTPSITVSTSSTHDVGYIDITPSGSVTSSFSGSGTKFSFIGTQTKLSFSGTSGNVSVTGTPLGSVNDTDLGSKSVTVSTTNATLEHTLRNNN